MKQMVTSVAEHFYKILLKLVKTVPEPQDAAAGAAEKTVSEAPDTPNAGQDEAVGEDRSAG